MKIFGDKLTYLYRCGSLDIVLRFMKSLIVEEALIEYNDNSSCFQFDNNQVVKLCTTDVKYFQKFHTTDASKFQQLSATMPYILLPINYVLYNDEHVFAYTQPTWGIFDVNSMDTKSFFEIIQMIRILLDNNVTTSISAHYLGTYSGRVIITEYPNLRPLELNNDWRHEMSKQALKYINIYYLHNNDHNYLKTLKNTHLPAYCHTFYHQLNDASLSRLDLINACDVFLNHLSIANP